MLASISSLVKAPWPQQGCARFTTANADVLAVVSGPSESKAVRKADPTQGVIEVVAVSSDLQEDTKLLESLLKDCLSAVIDLRLYPNLTVTVTVVVFSSVGNVVSR
jgi:ribonuclease PH